MTILGTRNGYTRLLNADPDRVDVLGLETYGDYGGIKHGPKTDRDTAMKLNNSRAVVKGKKKPPPALSRPGLFYMFGDRRKYATNHISVVNASQSESEQEAELIELTEFKSKKLKLRLGRLRSGSSGVARSPKICKTRTKFKFSAIEEPLLPGDTLQRVALRYNCPTSEIRRLNNLYSDQDFFALKTVKIPVREYGILNEPQAREKCQKNIVDEAYHSSGGATSDELRLGGPNAYYKSDDEYEGSSVDADDEVGDNSDSPEVRDVSIHSALKWKHSQRALLEKFREELEKVRENTEQRLANLNEVAITLTTPTILPIMTHTKDSFEKRLLSINFDWRIMLVAGIVFIATLILSIVGYIESKSKK